MDQSGGSAGTVGLLAMGSEVPSVRRSGVTLSLHGEQDASTIGLLRDLIGSEAAIPGLNLVIDLSDVTFIDSSTLGVLLAAREALEQAHARLSLTGASPWVLRLLVASDVIDMVAEAGSPDGSGDRYQRLGPTTDSSHGEISEASCACGLEDPDRAAVSAERNKAAVDRAQAELMRRHALVARKAAARDWRRASVARRQAHRDRTEASTDDLTGALRRREGFESLQHEIDRCRRTKAPLVIAFVDVDGLKSVNDTRGHSAGDSLLQSVVSTLRVSLRSYDVVVRFGGDEFVCSLAGAGLDVAVDRFERMGQAFAALHAVTLSAGFAELQDDDTLGGLIRRADADLYARRRSLPNSHVTTLRSPQESACDDLPR